MHQLTKQVDSAVCEEKTHSEYSQLFTALSKAQSEMGIAAYDKTNPHFKNRYASMESIIAATRPALTKYGLSVFQKIVYTENFMKLSTVLAHSSGEFVESVMPINPSEPGIQKLGSYLTYCKRYSYVAIVGCATGDEDDDGEEDRKSVTSQKESQKTNVVKMEVSKTKEEVKKILPKEPLTQPQINFMNKLFEERGITYEEVQELWSLPALKDVLQTQLEEIVKNIKDNWQPKAKK